MFVQEYLCVSVFLFTDNIVCSCMFIYMLGHLENTHKFLQVLLKVFFLTSVMIFIFAYMYIYLWQRYFCEVVFMIINVFVAMMSLCICIYDLRRG